MSEARALEYRIVQQLMQDREKLDVSGFSRLSERVITAAAVTAGMLLVGSAFQELLWVLLGASAILTIGTK